MKKKGLIIATIVMVLVLAVSLTTATYAWFTTTAATTIESITVKAAAGAEVKVGMKQTNAYAAGASQDAFVSGNLTWDASTKWAGDPGMGFELVTGLSLASIDKATGYGTVSNVSYTETANPLNSWASNTKYYTRSGSGTEQSPYVYTEVDTTAVATPDSSTQYYTRSGEGTAGKFTPGGSNTGTTIVKASGTSSLSYDVTSVEAAVENRDYLHFVLGVSPSVATIDTITISLFVNPGTNKNAIGVEAALYCYYAKDGAEGQFSGGEIYDKYGTGGGTTITYNTSKDNINGQSTIGQALNSYYSDLTSSTVTTYTDTTTLNKGWREIDIRFGTIGTAMSADEVHQVEIYIFYDGTDVDCINSALGSECGILFAITNTKA